MARTSSFLNWRREWDSNSRTGYPVATFLPHKAEGTRFELVKAFTLLPFQGSALDRYANPLNEKEKETL